MNVYVCEHRIEALYDAQKFGWWYQHGDNPEARMFIDDFDLVHRRPYIALRLVRLWANRIHAYEAKA